MNPLKTMTQWAEELAAETAARNEAQKQRQIALDAAGVGIREYFKQKGFTEINFKSEPPGGFAILDALSLTKFALFTEDNIFFSLAVYDVSNMAQGKAIEKLEKISIEDVYAILSKYIDA